MIQTDQSDGRLHARPGVRSEGVFSPGIYSIDTGLKDARLSVPTASRDDGRPLIVFFHGAGGNADQATNYFGEGASEIGCLLLAMKSDGPTWDGIRGGYGSDVAATDIAIQSVFDRFDVDPGRVCAAGFSDGASYALSLGLLNGDLFRHIFAFSPGFIIPTRQVPTGRPEVFISHGSQDTVLPIGRTSRQLTPMLERSGYHVDYREFDGGHNVPSAMVRAALGKLDARATT